MKYLKTYESNKWGPIYSGTNDTLYINPQDIEDCLVDIIHLGFSINRTKIVNIQTRHISIFNLKIFKSDLILR